VSALARVTLPVTAVSVASYYKEGLKVSNCSEMGKFHPEEIKTIRRMRNSAPESYIQKQSNAVIFYTVTHNCWPSLAASLDQATVAPSPGVKDATASQFCW
jgi:hypothetical protein